MEGSHPSPGLQPQLNSLAPSMSTPLLPEQRRSAAPKLKSASCRGLVKTGFNCTHRSSDSKGSGMFSAQAKFRITWGVF